MPFLWTSIFLTILFLWRVNITLHYMPWCRIYLIRSINILKAYCSNYFLVTFSWGYIFWVSVNAQTVIYIRPLGLFRLDRLHGHNRRKIRQRGMTFWAFTLNLVVFWCMQFQAFVTEEHNSFREGLNPLKLPPNYDHACDHR